MENFRQLFQYILSGLSNGAIYALIGFGFAVIYNATGIINFAQGEFVMLGGMLTIFFLSVFQIPLVPAILLAIIVSTMTGIVFERFAIRPLKDANPLSMIIITIGASIFIRGAAMLIWGKDTHALLAFSGDDPCISLAPPFFLNISGSGVTILIIIASRIFFYYSIVGKAMRACSYNPRAAGWSVLM